MYGQLTLDDREEMVRLKVAWEAIIEELAPRLPRAHVLKFLRPLRPVRFEKGEVEVEVPGAFVAEWVKNKYLGQLQLSLSERLGEPIEILFTAVARERNAVTGAEPTMMSPSAVVEDMGFRPNPRYTFDSFVVGQANRMAIAGSKAVALEPGTRINPLFIYAPSGLGKTHLMHGIAHEIRRTNPRANIVYITAQHFAEQFVQALQSGRMDQFRRAQRSGHVWLVDDIQFIAGKDKTQEEIFHTFNSLHQSGRQIVLCSDRSTRELYLLDERLRSRFESGLVVDIQTPDTETKAAILLSKAQQDQIILTPEVAIELASQVRGNIRVLEGALTKLAVMASIENSPLTLDLAQAMIDQYYSTYVGSKPTAKQIMESVGRYYNVSANEILSPSRKAPIAHARHVAVYLTRQITNDSWKHIGSQFGNRDHTSMMHAFQKISEMAARDRDLAGALKVLWRDLSPE